MAVNFSWAQSNGSGNTVTQLGSSGNIFNFKNVDSAGLTGWETSPILASDVPDEGRSYEVWLRGYFSGDFNEISNFKFYQASPMDNNTGIDIYFGTTDTYATPVNVTSVVATDPVPVSEPVNANIGVGGDLEGALLDDGYTDYIVLQLKAGSTAEYGATGLGLYHLDYEVR